MAYKTFASLNIAIIGAGHTGKSFAAALALAGHEIFLAWKDGDEPQVSSLLHTLKNLHICSIEEAAAVADVIIIATPPAHVREVAYWLGDVRRKVIIDASANAFNPGDEYLKTACAIKAITGSAHVVKMFNAKGYEHILTPIFKKEVDLVIAGDSKKAKEVARILADELGLSKSFDLGDNQAIPLFDEMTRAWRNLTATQPAVQPQFSLPRA